VLKKKPKDDLDNKNNSTSFGGGISGKQMTIDAYNTLIKMLAK
jgi:predicted outer membrane repeat protein